MRPVSRAPAAVRALAAVDTDRGTVGPPGGDAILDPAHVNQPVDEPHSSHHERNCHQQEEHVSSSLALLKVLLTISRGLGHLIKIHAGANQVATAGGMVKKACIVCQSSGRLIANTSE